MLITSFYSYKGGVGRTMALANTAWELVQRGYRVAVLDLDLEAPGLHRALRIVDERAAERIAWASPFHELERQWRSAPSTRIWKDRTNLPDLGARQLLVVPAVRRGETEDTTAAIQAYRQLQAQAKTIREYTRHIVLSEVRSQLAKAGIDSKDH